MIISVYNQDQELLIQTVSVHHNAANPAITHLFFCPYCSHQIVQIQGIVGRISPGLTPTDKVVVINKCPRCEMRYTIQDMAQATGYTKVTIARYQNKEHAFRCYICRTPLMAFDDNQTYLLPTGTIVELPISIHCPNFKCVGVYKVIDIV